MSPIAVFAKLTAKTDQRDKLQSALENLVAAAKGEEGTLLYALHQDNANPDTFWVYELYADQGALDTHSSSPAMAEALGSLGDVLDEAPMLQNASPLQGKNLPI